MGLVNTTTTSDFAKYTSDSDKVAVVDFWAAWCPPCRMMAPVLEAIAKDMDEQLDVVKVDVEASGDNQMLASKHGVQGIPNLQIYKAGKLVDELVGYRPKEVLLSELKKHLA